MQILYGHSGWIRVERDDLPGWLYLRLAADSEGAWRTRELYLEGELPVSASTLRRLPLAHIEAVVTQGEGVRRLEASMRKPGPQLSIMAEMFTTAHIGKRPNCASCGALVNNRNGRALTWLETSWWAQFPDSEVTVNRPSRPRATLDKAERQRPPKPPPLSAPEGRLTGQFLRGVGEAYDAAVERGEAPAQALAAQANVPVRTVHRWIYTARKRGIMPKGKQGRIG